jgi:predicted transcriptional regulator
MATPITPIEKGTTVELGFDAEARQAIADFAEATKAIEVAEAQRKEAQRVLREKLGLHEFATIGGVPAVKMVQVLTRKDVNRKLLTEKFDDVAQEVLYENPYEYLSVVK